jgi:hypothetical protein
VTVDPWAPDAPTRCACAGAYRPQLNGKGKLVKAREPAWAMAEQTRDPGCLQERCRALSKAYRTGYQHHKRSDGSGAGYPDCHFWVPVRADGGGSAYAELKKMGSDPTPDQVRVMAELQDAGHLVYLVRPCCLLVGVVDEILAALAGVRCLYVGGHPAGPPTSFEDILGEKPAADPPPAPHPVRPARPRREPALDGREPGEPFPDAVGYIVPMPCDEVTSSAVRDVEWWLRAAGFSPPPYPIRLVVGADRVLVHVRAGLARAGSDPRVWREGRPVRPFPEKALDGLGARVVPGPDSAAVTEAIELTFA